MMRNRKRRRILPLLLALAAACLPALAHGEGAPPQVAVTLEGGPGEVRVSAAAPLSVRSETEGGTVRWVVLCTSVEKAAKGVEAFVKPVPGGVAIQVALADNPRASWEPSGFTVRWSAGSPPPSPPGDPFADTGAPAYPLGPGDKLQITVFNVDNMNESAVVDPAGFVTFPVLDKVYVANLTVNELQRKLEDLLSQYVKDPQVSLQLLEYGSRYVNVLGNVQAPGRIPLKGAFRVLDAVTQAGGFLEKSGDVEIQRRDASGKLESRVFNKEDLLAGTQKANIYVRDQDVINVQPPKQVFVSGQVKSPGALPYAKNLTLLQAITLAGGFDQWAKKDPVDVLRDVDGKPTVIHVDAGRIERGKDRDFPLQPNDQIVVRERKFF
jgi:polysaccharide export outer membrane protein